MLLLEPVHPTLRLGVVRALRVRSLPSPKGLLDELGQAEARLRRDPGLYPESVRGAIRDVLRVGGYKPTGRGKPASELLLALALKESLPRIGNLVEINNLVSLESALPSSIFDAQKLGPAPLVRFGASGESYVFNQAGHAMDLEGLPVVCRSVASGPPATSAGATGEPIGNAVRDSMKGKVDQTTTSVLAVVYGSSKLPTSTLLDATARLASLLREYAEAEGVETALL
jgi:DNA/RNA-binding domain of Phe-tRNA-synthetase-like protein